MRDPAEEAAMLAALRAFLAPCRGLVTFNGKAFDAPLLNARYRLNGADSPLTGLVHLDLLPLARRLWRDRLVSRALGSLEENILCLPRTAEDVPGWLIPEMYFDYIRGGDARPLKGIFYHNEVDVLSMAALLGYVTDQLADPLQIGVHALDVMSMAKLFAALGDTEQAIALYRESMARGLPEDAHWDTAKRLALIYKRGGAWPEAIELWEGTARAGHVEAHVELAKYYEHKCKAYAEAIHWTQAAIACVKTPGFDRWKRATTLDELTHRLGRLKRKASAKQV
jgi:tetratricopeptide (TPR) repeat protein